jgi:hypothetical protein
MQFLLTKKPAFYYDNANIRKKVETTKNLTNIYSDTYIISRRNVCLSVIKICLFSCLINPSSISS